LKQTSCSGLDFPYKAKCPSNAKTKLFKDINDVYDEIMRVYEVTEENGECCQVRCPNCKSWFYWEV